MVEIGWVWLLRNCDGEEVTHDLRSVTRAVSNFVVSFLVMQLLEDLPCRITLHSHGRPLCLGFNVRFELRQIKNADQPLLAASHQGELAIPV
jgi:hypothetical protein